MAEIPLQQKERRNSLPLILIALAVLALLAWYFMRDRTVATTGAADTTRTNTDSVGRAGGSASIEGTRIGGTLVPTANPLLTLYRAAA